MKAKLEELKNNALAKISNSADLENLQQVKIKYLGRKGELNSIRKGLKDLPEDEKPLIGALANETAGAIEKVFESKYICSELTFYNLCKSASVFCFFD